MHVRRRRGWRIPFLLCTSSGAHSLSLLSITDWLVCENRFNLIGGSCSWSFLHQSFVPFADMEEAAVINWWVCRIGRYSSVSTAAALPSPPLSISSIEMKGTIGTQSDILPPRNRGEPGMSCLGWMSIFGSCRTSTIDFWQLVMVMNCRETSFPFFANQSIYQWGRQ